MLTPGCPGARHPLHAVQSLQCLGGHKTSQAAASRSGRKVRNLPVEGGKRDGPGRGPRRRAARVCQPRCGHCPRATTRDTMAPVPVNGQIAPGRTSPNLSDETSPAPRARRGCRRRQYPGGLSRAARYAARAQQGYQGARNFGGCNAFRALQQRHPPDAHGPAAGRPRAAHQRKRAPRPRRPGRHEGHRRQRNQLRRDAGDGPDAAGGVRARHLPPRIPGRAPAHPGAAPGPIAGAGARRHDGFRPDLATAAGRSRAGLHPCVPRAIGDRRAQGSSVARFAPCASFSRPTVSRWIRSAISILPFRCFSRAPGSSSRSAWWNARR